jgi:hypothetical protein
MSVRLHLSWKGWMTVILLGLAAAFYGLHYLIFRDVRHIFIYLISDIGFLFLNVLVVVLVIEDMLERREKKALLQKMNMVIGTFFSEVGLDLLRRFSTFAPGIESLTPAVSVTGQWTRRDFEKAQRAARDFKYVIRVDPDGLAELRLFLADKYPFLLRLLENPILLEHHHFTDLLWAVFHLTEELAYRKDRLSSLPANDVQHLAGDLKRAYAHIVSQWIAYVQNLKDSYPFLFSLAVRINPLSPNPSAIID